MNSSLFFLFGKNDQRTLLEEELVLCGLGAYIYTHLQVK
jgi:hypothetical protein